MSRRSGLHELYRRNPDRADLELFGRRTDPLTRRGFISGLGAMSGALGATIVFQQYMPGGLIPAALANSTAPFVIEGKNGLTVLNDRPVNAETPAHLLDDRITPSESLFVRNNGIPPVSVNPNKWSLGFTGESVVNSKTYTIAELKQRFAPVNLQLVLECGGNGRAEFYPPAGGNQWTLGAVGCPEWNGIRLRDVLEDCGVADDAVYVAFNGADTHLSGNPAKRPISRGVPLAKAMESESMIAWGMNGEDLHPMNGHPLRLVMGGWPGSVSGKWLNEIMVRDRIHDGAKMTGTSYRVPCKPVAPGSEVAEQDMCIIHSMPVKSLITHPETGLHHPVTEPLSLRGHAWAGDLSVSRMQVSIDFGQTWQDADLEGPANRLAWQHWAVSIQLPQKGYYEVWARATDEKGISQPMVMPGWNPKGYLNNATHRIAVYAI